MELEDWCKDVLQLYHDAPKLTHSYRHIGEMIKCLVRNEINAVHCGVSPAYSLSLVWPVSAGRDGPLVPQRGHNLVDLPGLS